MQVFERYELKYRMSIPQYYDLRELLEPQMQADGYGVYTICNLYYDTPDYRLIRASLDKPVYKEKLRLRSYGVPSADSTVYLELKKKYKGIVYKRRAPMTLREAGRYLAAGLRPAEDCQVLREIDWFLQFYHHPQPRAMIAYDRLALFGRTDHELRITFDADLRWRAGDLDLSHGDGGSPILLPGDPLPVLMEVKIAGAVPLWLCHILDRLEIRRCTFSKYGACYQNHLFRADETPAVFPAQPLKGGIICA